MQQVERWTCDQQVVGSNPTRGQKPCNNLGQVVHTCASVTKQYRLVPAKERWCSAAAKVSTGLAESNGSLTPGGWLLVTCGLTACTLGSAPGSTLGNEYGKPLPENTLQSFDIWCLILHRDDKLAGLTCNIFHCKAESSWLLLTSQ